MALGTLTKFGNIGRHNSIDSSSDSRVFGQDLICDLKEISTVDDLEELFSMLAPWSMGPRNESSTADGQFKVCRFFAAKSSNLLVGGYLVGCWATMVRIYQAALKLSRCTQRKFGVGLSRQGSIAHQSPRKRKDAKELCDLARLQDFAGPCTHARFGCQSGASKGLSCCIVLLHDGICAAELSSLWMNSGQL